ncbi:hypothetical protein [Paenibacillus sp. UNC451MF]|uniref:hypothetical protein n=1 Tax=Paenibacillus sp. UNC451MF TaxID=1449063 RepID=UPI00048B7BD7|nr:hypothetical protein [Paenibacillus sp. UNC451MF]
MHAFRRLLLTDLRNRRNTLLVALGATVLLNAVVIVLMIQMFLTEGLDIVTLLDITVFSVMLLIPFLRCFSSWRDEWRQHGIYHLLSLPIPRTYLLLSKYISIVWEVLLITAIMIIGLWVQYGVSGGKLFRAEPLITFEWAKVGFVAEWFLLLTNGVFLSFMSALVGKWCGKWSHLAAFISFVVGALIWGIAYINLPSMYTLIVLALLFFGMSVYLLEKKVGVE